MFTFNVFWRRLSVLKSGTAQSRPIRRRRLSTNPPRHGHSDQWRSHGSIIDAYARKIVGWRVSSSAHAGFVLDALEQAVHDRRPGKGMGLVHHSDRGSQYLSIRYTERLAEAGIEPSVGSVGDRYDNVSTQ